MDTIKELQEKAFKGDAEALEAYNEYVKNGQAPAIAVQKEQTSQGLMADGYKKESEKRGDVFPSPQRRELSEEELKEADPITKMSHGYEAIKQEGEK